MLKASVDRNHNICVLCKFYEELNGHDRRVYDKRERLFEIKFWHEHQTQPATDMKQELQALYPGLSVELGQKICHNHLQPLPNGASRYSKYCHPVLRKDLLSWQYPSRRQLKERTFIIPEKRPRMEIAIILSEREQALTKELELWKLKCEELERTVVTYEIKENEWKLKEKMWKEQKINGDAPIDGILRSLVPGKATMAWLGISSFNHFYSSVRSHITPYASHPPFPRDGIRGLQRILIMLRGGFLMRVAQPLLEPHRTKRVMRSLFSHVLEDLFPWALKQITLPTVSEWAQMSTEKLESLFPGILFFFIDGTVLEIWKPTDIKKNRSVYNSKHGYSALSYFIAVTPTGRIVYLSLVDSGSTHDSTSWNTAPAFPPVIVTKNGVEPRPDAKTFIQSLQEYYGKNGEARQKFTGFLKTFKFAIGGDKAYPKILLPFGWHLYVTATAGEEDSILEADAGRRETEDIMRERGEDTTDLFNEDDGDFRNMTPEIARPRGVVERVIGAMKDFRILGNVAFLSQQDYRTIFMTLVVIAGLCNYNLDQRGTSY
jgi:hypothetical protein